MNFGSRAVRVGLVCFAAAVACTAQPVEKAEAAPADGDGITLAVIEFDNVSGQNLPGIGQVAHDVLNSYLVGLPGVSVVTRDKLNAVLKEQDLGSSGLVGNRAKSKQLAQLLGADYMVTGSVLQYATDVRRFNAFGARTVTVFHRMKVSLQIVDLGTAKLSFAKTYDLEYKDTGGLSAGTYLLAGRERDLLDGLINLASEDLKKAVVAHAGVDAPGKLFKFPVSTTPTGADIEVDGVYLGSTPADIEVEEGTHAVKLTLQGFRPWEKKVKVGAGLKVAVSLAPLPHEEKIVIEKKIN